MFGAEHIVPKWDAVPRLAGHPTGRGRDPTAPKTFNYLYRMGFYMRNKLFLGQGMSTSPCPEVSYNGHKPRGVLQCSSLPSQGAGGSPGGAAGAVEPPQPRAQHRPQAHTARPAQAMRSEHDQQQKLALCYRWIQDFRGCP